MVGDEIFLANSIPPLPFYVDIATMEFIRRKNKKHEIYDGIKTIVEYF